MCKKIRLLKSVFSALLLGGAIAMPLQSKAELLISDDFDYPVGALYNTNGWIRYNSYTNDPMQVVEGSLSYDGYHSPVGNSVSLVKNKEKAESLVRPLYPGQAETNSGTYYYSALINISNAPSKSAPFIGFTRSSGNACADGNGTSMHGGLVLSSTYGGYKIGIAKSSNTLLGSTTTAYPLNTTHLVIVKYEFVDGTTNDRVSLWVDPEASETEPTPAISYTSQADPGGIVGFALFQNYTTSLTPAVGIVDAVRVATTWADLFSENAGSGETPAEPVITVGSTELSFPETYSGFGTTRTLNIKATDLTEDITIGGLTPEFTAAVSTIAKEDAMSAEGYNLVINQYLETEENANSTCTLTLTSGSATSTVTLKSTVYGAKKVTNAKEVQALTSYEGYVSYIGSMTITAVDTYNGVAYAQDAQGGVAMNIGYLSSVPAVGQEVTKVFGATEISLGAVMLMPFAIETGQTGLTVEPTVLTAADMLADIKNNVFKLITIEGVDFTPEDGQTFANSTVRGTQNGTAVAVMPLRESTLQGNAVPTRADITGISRSVSGVTLIPRGADDVVAKEKPVEPPTLTVSTQMVNIQQAYSGMYYHETVNVQATNLTEDIAISGLPEGFSTDITAIPMEEAMKEGGYDLVLNFYIESDKQDYKMGNLTLTSGSASKTITLFAMIYASSVAHNAKEVQALPTNAPAAYNGKAIVTAVDAANSIAYAQDSEGGIAIKIGNLRTYPEVGYEIRNMLSSVSISGSGVVSLQPIGDQYMTMNAGTTTVAPAELTASELADNRADNMFRLVKLTDVDLNRTAGQIFEGTTVDGSQNGTAVAVSQIAGSSLMGKEIPAKADVTGVMLDNNTVTLLARNADDILAKAAPAADPVITVASSLSMGELYEGFTAEKILNIKATDLTEDITVNGVAAPFYVETTTIAKEDAMSENGYDLKVSFKPTSGGNPTCTMTLVSGAATAEVTLRGAAYSVNTVKFSTAFNNLASDAICRYTGNATVTYVHPDSKRVYAQDMLGGIAFDFIYFDEMPQIKVGDQISNLFGSAYQETSNINLLQVMSDDFTVTDAQKTIEPLEVLASEIKASPESYIHRLVKITDVTFTPTEGQKFTTGFTRGTQNETQVNVQGFSNSSLIGVAVPQQASITGISTALAVVTVKPRGAEDVVEKALDPALEVTAETLFTGECAPMGESTVVARFTADATALPAAAEIWLGGANRGMFSLSVETLPAGSGKTVVDVLYTPTSIGKHTASINFDTTPTTLSYTKTFTFYAYDPANMPAIEIAPATVEAFTAKAGETQEKEIKVNGKNLPDNGTIRVMGDANGAFVINNTLLSKYGEMTLKVTFKPQAEGTFTERIELDAMMCEPIYLTVTGTCTDALAAEEKEGDELPLSTLSPLTLLNEAFDTAVKNKPLALDGWKNLALDGTRAWWGYTFDNDNQAAKVTAYDSKIEAGEGTPAQMMLVTPALDFINSGSKIFTFEIMGQNLSDEMTDLLEVVYIDMEGDEMYVAPIANIDIPVTADRNNEWVPVTINFENSDLADVFFIGFRFTATRGRDNSAIYYIDNVTYGRTDLPFIMPEATELKIEANALTPSSVTLAVEGRNLDSEIKVAVGGDNPSRFTVSPATLPAEGGTLTITFLAEEEGQYAAELTLTAEGAPATVVSLIANNGKALDAIDTIDIDSTDADAEFFNLQGIRVNRENLNPGYYIVRTADKVAKVFVGK